MFLRSTQQKRESSVYVKSEGTVLSAHVKSEDMNLTPNTASNIFNGRHSRGSRGLPKVTRPTQSTPDIGKRWCKRHIEDEVRQTTARARAVDSPGDITLPCDNEPC